MVVSAPKSSESKHNHPHKDAIEFYAEKVGPNGVLHMGDKRHCFIWDIYSDGTCGLLTSDDGKLAKAYPIKPDDGGKAKYIPPTGVEKISGSRYA